MSLRKIVPSYVLNLAFKMGLLMFLFTVCRVLFLTANRVYFSTVQWSDFFAGMWFDLITTFLLCYPLLLVQFFPLKNRSRKGYRYVLFCLTLLPFSLSILVNLIDVEYFRHTTNRSTSGLFTMLGFGRDFIQQIPYFIVDYWYLLLLYVAAMAASSWLVKWVDQREDDSVRWSYLQQTVIYLLAIAGAVIIGRGGLVLRPIQPTEAAKFTDANRMPLVLNSAFTVLHSIGNKRLVEKQYMTAELLKSHYSPHHQFASEGRLRGQNIVLLILESFAPEYISHYNKTTPPCTPFFDQLADSSLCFTHCFANGKKSMDALPSIVSSIPKLMDKEYLVSEYAVNRMTSLPDLLREMGYETGFFHGATDGSMNFDVFCSAAGFDRYFGRSAYGNDEDYDGTWGIFDEPFLQWSISQFNQMRQPFFTAVFTLSSHAPYTLPEQHKKRFSKGATPMHKVVSYADYALERFFESARQQEWYPRTLFVLVADHTPSTQMPVYATDFEKMHIPLLLYHPTDTFFRGVNEKVVGQIDLLPSLLELVGYQRSFFAFGRSVFSSETGFTAAQIGGYYLGVGAHQKEHYMLRFQNDTSLGLYHFSDRLQKDNLLGRHKSAHQSLERQMKALIQTYNHALLSNEMRRE